MMKRTIGIFLFLLPMLMGDHFLHAQDLDSDDTVSKRKRYSLIISEHFIVVAIEHVINRQLPRILQQRTIQFLENVHGIHHRDAGFSFDPCGLCPIAAKVRGKILQNSMGGAGGGNDRFAQGAAPDPEAAAVREALETAAARLG